MKNKAFALGVLLLFIFSACKAPETVSGTKSGRENPFFPGQTAKYNEMGEEDSTAYNLELTMLDAYRGPFSSEDIWFAEEPTEDQGS